MSRAQPQVNPDRWKWLAEDRNELSLFKRKATTTTVKPRRKLKPVMIRDVSALIDIMAETADILSPPRDWLGELTSTCIMMTGKR